MLSKLKSIPTLPQVTVELIQLVFSDEPDISKIARVIQQDATLTAKLFKTVNSAAYGLRVEVQSIHQAISIVGLDMLRTTISTIALGEYLINKTTGNVLDVKSFCIHSLATAIIMEELAVLYDMKKEKDLLYLIGLLHDFGRLALDMLPDGDYREVLNLNSQGMGLEEAERNIYGIDNRQAWRMIARDWTFPSQLIKLYNGSVKGDLTTQTLVEDANNIANSLGYDFIEDHKPPLTLSPETAKLIGDEEIARIGDAAATHVEILSNVLNLPAPDQNQTFKTLFKTAKSLSMANTQHKKTQNELQYRVEVLQELTRVFTGIIKCLHGESLSISVLEALIDGFHANSAFILNFTQSKDLEGYTARINDDGVPGFFKIALKKKDKPRCFVDCINSNEPIKIDQADDLEQLINYIGPVPLIWLTPILVRGACASIVGIGVDDKTDRKFKNVEFGSILKIVAGEIGLSIENIQLYNRVKKEARTDALTCINNRRTIMKVLNSEFSRYKRKPSPLSVALFDLDNFKAVNDTMGHLAGDEFLKKIADIINAGIRNSDYIGRFGGDEFIAVFPETTIENAVQVVERIREQLHVFCNEYDQSIIGKPLSVSVGVACATESMKNSDELIHCADTALYEAKEQGRNRCIMYDSALPVSD